MVLSQVTGNPEVESFDRIAGIEWNPVEFYRICCMARSLRSLGQVATLRHGHMARRSAGAETFRQQPFERQKVLHISTTIMSPKCPIKYVHIPLVP